MESALYGLYSLVVSYNKAHSLAKPRSFVLLYARTFHVVFSVSVYIQIVAFLHT